MRILLIIALRNLSQARRRTALLGGALATVTALLVLLMALSQGISQNIISSATVLATGHINVSGFYKASSSDSAPIVTDAARLRQVVEANTPGLASIAQRHRGWAQLVSPEASTSALLAGVQIDQEPALIQALIRAPRADYWPTEDAQRAPLTIDQPELVEGDMTRLGEPDTAVLFAAQARRLRVKVGDPLTLRTRTFTGASNTRDVTVVGVARDLGILSNFSVFVPTQVILDLYQLQPDTTGALQLYLDDIDEAQSAMAALRPALEREGFLLMPYQPDPFFAKFEIVRGEDWIGQRLDLTVWEDEVNFLTWILRAIDTVSYTLIAILVAIIAVGVMNTMWIAVRRRTQEIGTVRAMGMQRAGVMALFVLEAFLLGLFASLSGAMLGAIIALTLTALSLPIPLDAMRAILLSDTLLLATSPGQLARAVLAMTAFTTLAALWPALRAARLRPIEAIQRAE